MTREEIDERGCLQNFLPAQRRGQGKERSMSKAGSEGVSEELIRQMRQKRRVMERGVGE